MWKKTISVNTAHNFVREKSQYFSVTSCCALQWSHAPQYERRHMLTDQISFNFVYFTFSLPRPLSSSLLLCEVKCRATSAAIELLAARGEGKGGKLSPNLAIVSANRWNRARNFVLLLLLLLLSRLALDLWPNKQFHFIYMRYIWYKWQLLCMSFCGKLLLSLLVCLYLLHWYW